MKAIENGLTIRRIEDVKDLMALHLARREAKLPYALNPTHVFERDGKIVGYASMNAIPLLTGWLHDDRVSEDESRKCFEALDEIAREQGLDLMVMPCTEDCRFLKSAETMGWRKVKKATLFMKRLMGEN